MIRATRTLVGTLALVALWGASGCAQTLVNNDGSLSTLELREAFPFVRVDVRNRVVEFDASVSPMLTPDARAPRFYLEVTCCTPNSREHEAFIVTKARPSHIHAALLAIGLKPGAPGGFLADAKSLKPVQPAGDAVEIRVLSTADPSLARPATHDEGQDPLEWIINAKDGGRFLEIERATSARLNLKPPGWVFAGSRFVERRTNDGVGTRSVYDADGAGNIIGLTTFGNEVIAYSRTISPDSTIDAPEWIADFQRTPRAGDPVLVRIRPKLR